MQPHISAERLPSYFFFFLPDQLLMLISNFLPETVQRVFVNGQMSKISGSNTGATQGCLSSPFLFIMCTDSCRASQQNAGFLMALSSYRYFKAQSLTTDLRCRSLFSGVTVLDLSVSKTKRMWPLIRKIGHVIHSQWRCSNCGII